MRPKVSRFIRGGSCNSQPSFNSNNNNNNNNNKHTRVNPSASAVIKGCLGQLKIQLKKSEGPKKNHNICIVCTK